MSCSVCGKEAVYVAADRDSHAVVCDKEACLDRFANGAPIIGYKRRTPKKDRNTLAKGKRGEPEATGPDLLRTDEVFDTEDLADDDEKEDKRQKEDTMDTTGDVVSLTDIAKQRYMKRLDMFKHDKFPHRRAGRIFDRFILDEKDCPIWQRYKVLRFLGSGSYGMVFEISNIPINVTPTELATFTPENTEYYALKCESLSSRGSQGMQEVQAEVAINELLLRLDKTKTINVLHMYDWLRCRTILSDHIPRNALGRMSNKIRSEMLTALNTMTDWQMTLMEDADHTLEEFYGIQRLLGGIDKNKMIQAVCVQVFCTLYMLQKMIDFRHGDLSANNVMMINAKKKIRDEQFVVYHLVDRRLAFIVPLHYTAGMLAVLSDKGFSSARYRASDINSTVELKANSYAYYPTSEIKFVGNLQTLSGGFKDAKTNELVEALLPIDFRTKDPKYRINYVPILKHNGLSTFRYNVPDDADFTEFLKSIISRPFNLEMLSADINSYYIIPIHDEKELFRTSMIQAQRT